jgi:putative Holliday junction resolvase
MRKIGLDWGEARIGVAVSDPLYITAQPLFSIDNDEGFIPKLKSVIEQYGADEIILGLPRQMNGRSGIAASKVIAFQEKIKNDVPVKITLWDERLSTKMAQRSFAEAGASRRTRKANVDAAAASLILQNYMDSKKNE